MSLHFRAASTLKSGARPTRERPCASVAKLSGSQGPVGEAKAVDFQLSAQLASPTE